MNEVEPVLGSGRSSRKTSCEECHRLKLRCDKKVPCGSCIRRGCDSICPTGILRSIGRGKRSVTSDFPQLTAKISEMGERIRQLERAVANTPSPSEQSSHHPLLWKSAPPTTECTPAQTGEPVGSLSVSEDGNAIYFGPSAGTEALLSIEGASDDTSLEQRFSFTAITESFPFSSNKTTWAADQALEQLFAHLPLEVRAWSLCQIYFRNGCWTGMPIMQCEAVELLNLIYHPNTGSQHQSPATPQKIAVLYLIFALGSLVDLDLPSYNSDADHYFDVACAAMSIKPLFENPTVVTVQALTLISCYYAHGGRRFSMDGAWNTISLASNVSQAVARFTSRKFRISTLTQAIKSMSGFILGNIFHRNHICESLDASYCMTLILNVFSRGFLWDVPPGRFFRILAAHIRLTKLKMHNHSLKYILDVCQCHFIYSLAGIHVSSDREARWGYTKDVTAPIMEAFLTITKPSYEAVLAMDQKIRKYMHSTPFESFPKYENEPPSAFMQRHLIPLFSKIMLMYIHSGSFVESMRDTSIHPLSSSYSASFLSGYRNASEIIKADIMNFTSHPMLFTRWWAIWKSLFNAAIIVGTLATKYPSSKFAPHATVELLTAVDLIEKGAVSSGRARSGLAILRRLRDKAIGVYTQYSGHNLTPPPSDDPETEEELRTFAGYTRVVANKVLQRGPPQLKTPPQTDRRHPSPSSQWGNELDVQQEFDPSIIRYFDSVAPFTNVIPLPEPQGSLPFDDAGLFFTHPPNMALASNFQHAQNAAQEIQWAEFWQTA
ncbi:Zn(2)-C6 fungal-type domain-containing protein [Mycena sanguinolenta]|uniref:Zn(2)-C6 fungal-type domain-containing protein n=1 Tax=Mycena sanguinolenta TaxID=230812 RepID=A0A8H6ZJD5_9AGAR|nr:Zn(2)-C6 fungal-type domain-containing protein [Mycena sanguinolenta]